MNLHVRVGTALVVAVLLMSSIAQTAPSEPDWSAMSVQALERIAWQNRVSFGEVQSKEAKIAILRDAWQHRTGLNMPIDTGLMTLESELQQKAAPKPNGAVRTPTQATMLTDSSLPPPELFKPRLPDLREDNPLTRLFDAGLYIVGAFGTGVFIYGLYKGVALVLETMAGKKNRGDALQTLLTYGVCWGFLMLLLKGSIYAFLRLVFEFATSSMMWR